ncbi:putative reverse transcriptase domain, reverse transcriptase zinc-binding domain protein, partial [Tanacetum coccineum]
MNMIRENAWDIVGDDVVCVVKEFFVNGVLLKELNQTIIALFLRRHISDNILLAQELLHNYHLDRGTPRCAFKVDIQKVYDRVGVFLKDVLFWFGFHSKMVFWIMEYVSSTSFSLSIYGGFHNFFKGKRGLRQGDPLSPYLFTLVMGVLTVIIQPNVHDSYDFTFHHNYSYLDIVNLCFADGISLFAHGDVRSARVIMDSLNECKTISDLVSSIPKSTVYFCNVLYHVKVYILNVMPFIEGEMRRGKAKASWSSVCLPKNEGGLGIRRYVIKLKCDGGPKLKKGIKIIYERNYLPLSYIKVRAGMIDVSPVLEDILDWLIPKYKLRS